MFKRKIQTLTWEFHKQTIKIIHSTVVIFFQGGQ